MYKNRIVLIGVCILSFFMICCNKVVEDYKLNKVDLSELDLKCSIDVYQKGPHIYALLSIVNNTPYDIPLLTYMILYNEEDYYGGCFEIKHNGKNVKCTAPVAMRSIAYYLLKSGKEYRKEINLSEYNDFTKPGDYQIQYEVTHSVAGDNSGMLQIKSNEQSIKIEEDNIPDPPFMPDI